MNDNVVKKNKNLSCFKSVMLNYYFTALDNYDCETLECYVLNVTALVVLLVQ